MTQTITSIAAVDHVLDTTAGPVVLGIPLGVGKPNPFVNALYQRIKDNPNRQLTIITALSLEKPVGHSELAKIDMTRIDFINQLYGDEDLKRAQRVKATFINTP